MRTRLLFCVLLLSFTIHAQNKFSGIVRIEKTTTPIAAANVYLSSTSIGTQTGENGEFTINNFPEGRYELIVSCIGYETYHSFVRSDSLPENLNIFLQPTKEELNEVIVKNDPYDKDGWEKWGHFFMDNFIGTSPFSEDCKLLNREVLRFRYSKKTGVVKVNARSQLLIQNDALGYVLKYSLTRFEFNTDTRNYVYEGYPYFTEMVTTNKKQEQRWEENREEAFKGSLLHFMRSVYNNKIKQEQFEVRKFMKVSDAEKQRVREMYERQISKKVSNVVSVINANSTGKSLYFVEKDTGRIIHKDTLAYFYSVKQQIKQEEILLDILVDAKDISSTLDATAKQFTFLDKIEVVYIPKKKDPQYIKSLPTDKRFQVVFSTLTNQPGNLVFLSNGSVADGGVLSTSDYWSWWEKMCNKLPYNYR